ncbi:hypothetical protein AHAS_Ahas11G0034800 [Arachis hypogaea]
MEDMWQLTTQIHSVDNLIYGLIMSPKPWQRYAPEIGFSWGIVPSWWFRSDDKFHVAIFMLTGFAERSYKVSSPCATRVWVDHHMRTVVFNYVILNNESEDSYVWLLRPFLEAMKGKPPKSVMTDGDLVIKSTVGIVFPGAHYRLCSWHLLRNATAKVGRFGLS